MDFNLSDEQKLLQDSVDRWVRERYAFESWRKQVRANDGWTRANWKEMAELGWLGVAIPEEYGGLGGGAVETMIIMQAIGKGLVMEPYMATVILGGKLLEAGGSEAQKKDLLPKLAEGQLQLAFAFAEHGSRYDLNDIAVAAKADGAGFKISGKKIVVYNGPNADKLLVLARTSGGQRDAKGLSLFLVDNKAKGVVRRDYRTVDFRRASDISFEDVAVGADALVGPKDGASEIVAFATDHGAAAAVAEMFGCMQVLNETTLAYAKTRKQFGQPIGNFQVLQHRMVDMMMAAEQTHSLMLLGCLKLGAEAKERSRAVSAAKAQAGRGGRFVGQQSVQIHGGMGMTDELNVGHYMKRLMMLDTFLGTADWHTRKFADLA